MSFSEFPFVPLIHKALEDCGYIEPTPIQAKAIPHILAGKDVVACAQTGTGKTAAFVLPALNFIANQEPIRKPRVLILTPTRELAAQITKAADIYGKGLRFNIVSLVGGMSYDPQIRDLKRGADIIVATPGRLIDHMENKRVDLSHVDILVLDEADRMLDMGFSEDVENIAAQTPETRQTLMFSATVDQSLVKIMKRLLKNPVSIDLSQQQIDAPKIKQSLYKAKNMHHKSRMLKHFLNDENIFKAIIFSATKQNADRLATELRDEGFAAAPLHGDLRQNVRNRTIEGLRSGKIQFLVATDVAARGLDISDITHVINYDLPKFSEDYVHRIGRTGRAGKTGEAISFFTSVDMRNLQKIERYIGKRLTIQNDNFEYAETSGNTRSDAEKFSVEAMMAHNNSGGRSGRGGRQGGGNNRRFNDNGGNGRFGDKRRSDDRPRRSFDNLEEKPRRSFDDKPRESFGDKPRRSFDDKPRGSFGDKPRRSFDDKPRGNFDDKPRRSFNRDEPRGEKSFGEKRRFNDRPESSDRPRRSFDRDDSRSAKPFGEKRRYNDKPNFSDKPRKRDSEGGFNVFERPVYEFEKRDDNPKVSYKKRVDGDRPSRSDKPAGSKFKKDFRKEGSSRFEKSERPKFARAESSNDSRDSAPKRARSVLGGKNTKRPFRDAK